MPISERSFADRHQKAVNLLAALPLMSPPYSPADATLGLATFTTFVASVATANAAVGTTNTTFTDATNQRAVNTKTIQERCTQIVSYVKSNTAWKLNFPRIKQLADKVRGIKPPRKVVAPPAPQPGQPTPAPVKPRDRGDGSYADIAVNYRALVTAVVALDTYAPTAPNLTAVALAALATALEADNAAVAGAEQGLDGAQRKRFALYYDEPGGLHVKFQATKSAVKGQYGSKSPQWSAVKSMRW